MVNQNRHKLLRIRMAVYGLIIVMTSATGAYLLVLNQKVDTDSKSAVLRIETNDNRSKELALEAQAKRLAQEEAQKIAAARVAKEAADAAARGAVTPAMRTNNSPCNTSVSHNNPLSINLLVNKKHCIKPIGFVPPDLLVVLGTTLRAQAAVKYEAMIHAASSEGIAIRSTSSYRSYDQQVTTYNYWVAANGSVALADTVSARPGYSEHQTGLTVDLATGGCVLECFGTSSAYPWMQAHAANYGFIERYPAGKSGITGYSPEPWHYRYVGQAAAVDMKARNVATLEEYWSMPGGDY